MTDFPEFPRFEFDNFIVRAINPNLDAPHFLEYVSKPIVSDFIGSDNVPKNLDEAHRELTYWASLYALGRSYFWSIADLDNKMIGTAGFNNISRQHYRGEISYDLDPNYWGKGIMTNTIFKIIEFAFQEMELVRIQATVAKHNERSIKLMENLGFKKEGELSKYERLKGAHYDFYMYGITREV